MSGLLWVHSCHRRRRWEPLISDQALIRLSYKYYQKKEFVVPKVTVIIKSQMPSLCGAKYQFPVYLGSNAGFHQTYIKSTIFRDVGIQKGHQRT